MSGLKIKWRLSAFAIFTFFNPSVFATVFIPQSEGKMIQEAQFICAIETLDLKSERTAATTITKAKVKPLECFKGNLTSDFFVKWPGGSYKQDGKTYYVSVPGTPNLRKGTLAILYLWRSSEQDDFTVLSWTNGVVHLTRTPTHELVIPKSNINSTVQSTKDLKSKSKSKTAKSTATTVPYETLSSFRKRVEQVLSAPKPVR